MNNFENEKKQGMKKLGLGIIVDNPEGIEKARFSVMKSVLLTAVAVGAIKTEVKEKDGKTVVVGYMYVDDSLPEVPHDKLGRLDRKAMREAIKEYPILKALLKAGLDV